MNCTPFTLGPFQTNCYLVEHEDACWIIDASFEPEPMIETIRERNLTPEALILTHAHVDHIAGIPAIREAFPDVPIHLHKAEHDWLADPTLNLSAAMGLPVTTPPADATLEDGQVLALGGFDFTVLHTPGHSPGGVTLHNTDKRFALVGDTLFNGSIGRYDFPTSNVTDLVQSIRERLYALEPATLVLPGHGPSTTIEREMTSNPFVPATGEPQV